MNSIIQFWDRIDLPNEVQILINSWKEETNFSHSLYNRESGGELIRFHFGKEIEDTYNKCRIPAMQADYFRYCALYALGGCYLDADTQKMGSISSLIEGRETGLLMKRQDRIANDFMFVLNRCSPLLEYCIETATSNIRNRVSNNVWEVTGPGIMTAAYKGSISGILFAGFDIMPVQQIRRVVGFRHNLEYKKSTRDWRISQTSNSIYWDEGDASHDSV